MGLFGTIYPLFCIGSINSGGDVHTAHYAVSLSHFFDDEYISIYIN